MPPQLSFLGIHKRNHVFQESVKKLDPDNLEASLDKFKLTERRYKFEEIKRSFLETLKLEHKELIAEKPKNKQPCWCTSPNICYIITLHLRNLRKTLTKGCDRINNSAFKQLFPITPTNAFQRIRKIYKIFPEDDREKNSARHSNRPSHREAKPHNLGRNVHDHITHTTYIIPLTTHRLNNSKVLYILPG